MTTLADLKQAIARVEEYRAMPLLDQLKCNAGFSAAETNAWRIAFEWRHGWEDTSVGMLTYKGRDEFNEGMRLIEKLR